MVITSYVFRRMEGALNFSLALITEEDEKMVVAYSPASDAYSLVDFSGDYVILKTDIAVLNFIKFSSNLFIESAGQKLIIMLYARGADMFDEKTVWGRRVIIRKVRNDDAATIKAITENIKILLPVLRDGTITIKK